MQQILAACLRLKLPTTSPRDECVDTLTAREPKRSKVKQVPQQNTVFLARVKERDCPNGAVASGTVPGLPAVGTNVTA